MFPRPLRSFTFLSPAKFFTKPLIRERQLFSKTDPAEIFKQIDQSLSMTPVADCCHMIHELGRSPTPIDKNKTQFRALLQKTKQLLLSAQVLNTRTLRTFGLLEGLQLLKIDYLNAEIKEVYLKGCFSRTAPDVAIGLAFFAGKDLEVVETLVKALKHT